MDLVGKILFYFISIVASLVGIFITTSDGNRESYQEVVEDKLILLQKDTLIIEHHEDENIPSEAFDIDSSTLDRLCYYQWKIEIIQADTFLLTPQSYKVSDIGDLPVLLEKELFHPRKIQKVIETPVIETAFYKKKKLYSYKIRIKVPQKTFINLRDFIDNDENSKIIGFYIKTDKGNTYKVLANNVTDFNRKVKIGDVLTINY